MLRYLVVQPNHSATMDALMEAFWPDDEPDIAHHKLQVAASALRRSLNSDYNRDHGGGYLLSKRQTYQLNPAIPFHSDLDDFLKLYQAGRHTSGNTRADLYERACQLYKGPFLADDLYADWSSLQRGQLSSIYVTMCNALVEHYSGTHHYEDAMAWATATLKENHCDEAAHRHLMRAYLALGRRNEALLQYQLCQQTLFEELGVEPMPETVKLFHSLLSGEEGNEQ
jgi:DNA-binding SARP family transcriptional activator